MAMNPGTETAAAGTMAGAIFDAIEDVMGESETPAFAATRRQLAAAIAQGVCAHLAAHADVRITTSMAGIQRAGGTPTTAPAADVVLSGALE